MLLHDTHGHLDLLLQKMGALPGEKDLDLSRGKLEHMSEFEFKIKVVEEMLMGHDFLIHPTVSNENFNLVYSLLENFDKIYFLLGSHPEIVNKKFSYHKYLDEQQSIVLELESNSEMMNRVIGIGEVGLDYYYSQEKEVVNQQRKLFETQIQLAIKLNCPLIIHCRDAFEDLFEILRDYPKIHGRFEVHCFTGELADLNKVLDMGGRIGVSGIVTFNSGKNVQAVVKRAPMDSILLETDMPYLAPEPNRGRLCMPNMVVQVAEKVAEIKKLSTAEVIKQSGKNAQEMYGMIF